MSSRAGPPEEDREPLVSAEHLLAASIHQDLVNDLLGANAQPPGGSFEDGLDKQRQKYPYLLFGELAMHLADVQLPANPTPADRARGIVEALRRISSTPTLFEAITNAPFSGQLASGIAPELPETRQQHDKKEVAMAAQLRAKVAERGYLEQAMIPKERMVQPSRSDGSAPIHLPSKQSPSK